MKVQRLSLMGVGLNQVRSGEHFISEDIVYAIMKVIDFVALKNG